MYFCTASDEKYFPLLVNLIGSIHKFNFYDVKQIRVYDLGLTPIQRAELASIKKVVICKPEQTNPDIFKNIKTGVNRFARGLFSWKPVIIKDSLDNCPYILYLDAGITILKPLNNLFVHIAENGYFLVDCGHSIRWMTTKYLIDKFNLMSEENSWILKDDTFGIGAGFQGISRALYDSYVMPMYELSKDIKNFTDDGSCPDGWGAGRHDQALYSILARKLKLDIQYHNSDIDKCMLTVNGKKTPFGMTHLLSKVNSNTTIFHSRFNLDFYTYKNNTSFIKREHIGTAIVWVRKFIQKLIRRIHSLC